ncbi:two-component system capsular synthesis sensor histidine kinase RcsC [Luteibacter rhizovicinus]|uniref:histidine kinase n=1 Tax=Luteibacter rhizovicinus TaxID=242606 RepID=A0A4R3YQ58_9GAMM|nr:hybrid sensor histidine kinase/response regulator [Luteibacter rhizovicinus]TCV93334.1 two-component system capsular synthesis sensor histidine kinase RcsC [Luteibacter rhizovicinus]
MVEVEQGNGVGDGSRVATDEMLAGLRAYHRRLLYGGGFLLSLLIVVMMAGSGWQRIHGYVAQQRQILEDNKAAVDTYLIQRERGYARSLYGMELVWRERRELLTRAGAAYVEPFFDHGEQAVIRAGDSGVPMLVLGVNARHLPPEDIMAYLGLIHETSSLAAATVTEVESPGSLSVYGYDPSGSLMTFTRVASEQQLSARLGLATRRDLFARLRLNDEHLPARSARDPVISFSGINPLSGERSIVGVLTLVANGEPAWRVVAFEAFSDIQRRVEPYLRGASLVVTNSGNVVAGLGMSPEDIGEQVARAKRGRLTVATDGEPVFVRSGTRFAAADNLHGIDWSVVQVFSLEALLRATGVWLACLGGAALVCLVVLWFWLRHIDRRIFAPALRDAEHVFDSEELSRTIVSTSPVGLCLIDLDTLHPLLGNAVMDGFAKEASVAGVSLYARIVDMDRRLGERDVRPADKHGSEFRVEYRPTLATTRTLLIAARPTAYRRHRALLCVARDVTGIAELEEKLRDARTAEENARIVAESASAAKSAFVATISHEIRTPLSGIIGHLELLANGGMDREQAVHIARVRVASDSLLKIVGDVLDFSKIEAGQFDIEPVPFVLRTLVENSLHLFAPLARRKGLGLFHDIDVSIDMSYVGDAQRIGQVLNNLLGNAIRFTTEGAVTVRVRPSRGPRSPGAGMTALRFEIDDTGIGLASTQIEGLFEPFAQAEGVASRRYGGTGLGLALCRQLVTLMGGEIGVESVAGEGSTFSFTLPLKVSTVDNGFPRLDGKSIRLVSSDAVWRSACTSFLVARGAVVEAFASVAGMNLRSSDTGDVVVVGDQWVLGATEARDMVAKGTRVVRASRDGPLHPRYDRGVVFVSCYASDALLDILLTRRGPGAMRDAMKRVAHTPAAGRVLVVDDNPFGRELLRQQLSTLGYTTDEADSGKTALDMCDNYPYTAVLTDIEMPGMDGCELAYALRRRGSDIAVVAVTADAHVQERGRCEAQGVAELLLKPVTLAQLEDALRRNLPDEAWPFHPDTQDGSAELIEILMGSVIHDWERLVQAVSANEESGVLDRLHSLKGAFLMANEQMLAEHSAELERWIETHGLDDIGPVLQGLQLRIDERLDGYRARLNRTDTGSRVPPSFL